MESLSGSFYDSIFDKLAIARQDTPGHGLKPEPPTVICKVMQSGGVILSGLPTRANQDAFAPYEITYQVHCFDRRPWNRTGQGGKGIQLPSAQLGRVNMDSYQDAMSEFEEAFTETATAVLNGDYVAWHCIAGKHRAATACIPIRAALHNETVTQAREAIQKVRAVEFDKAAKHFNRDKWHEQGRGFGDLEGWLNLMTVKCTKIWLDLQSNRGIYKLVLSPHGTVVHGLKIPEGSSISEAVAFPRPMCQYRQAAETKKSGFGGSPTVTEASGKDAAFEAVTWTLAQGHLRLCARCCKYLPAGMVSVLEDGGVGPSQKST